MTHPHQTHTPPGALAKFKSFIPEAESLIQRIQSADVTDTDRQRARALVTEMTGLYQQNKGKTKGQGYNTFVMLHSQTMGQVDCIEGKRFVRFLPAA